MNMARNRRNLGKAMAKRVQTGLCLKSLGVPFRRALQEAHKLAVSGVELDATGDFAPRALSQTGRRETGLEAP